MAISDVALNPLAGPSTGLMTGYVSPSLGPEDLQLSMYNFLAEPIRYKDSQEGQLFVQRLLEGAQTIWSEDQQRIFSIKDLWSITDCPDDYLKYLKRIIGWTTDLDSITNNLSPKALRRLIAATAPLWKSRSTENSIVDVLNIIAGNYSRVWNWFDYRWILGETAFEEQHQGRDAWLVDMPGTGEEYWSTIRLIDPGVANRQLIKDVVNLMRPTGERYEIIYLHFLDIFDIDGDTSRWEIPNVAFGTALPTVADDVAKFTASGSQGITANNTDSYDWTDRIVYARMKGTANSTIDLGFGLIGSLDADGNGYFYRVDLAQNRLVIDKLSSWVATPTWYYDFSAVGLIRPDVWYGLRLQLSNENGNLRLIAYADGQEYINVLDTSPTTLDGTSGVLKTCLTAQCDELEVMGLPVQRDTVEINY